LKEKDFYKKLSVFDLQNTSFLNQFSSSGVSKIRFGKIMSDLLTDIKDKDLLIQKFL
jgi:hypothetical protein